MSVQPFLIKAQVPFTQKQLVGQTVITIELETTDGHCWNAPIICNIRGDGRRRVNFSDGRTAMIEDE